MRFVLLLILFCLAAAAESRFESGMEAYRIGDYATAMARFQAAYAESRDEDAAYMIAKMYEAGQGLEANRATADLWYRRAAQEYFSASADSSLHQENKRLRYIYSELDPVEDNETAETIRKVVVSDFGLKTYHVNYLLPFSYREGQYDSYVPSDKYINVEAEMQLSFRLDFFANLFGLDEWFSAAYTQRSFWQVYATSSPFRETDYQPEIFVTFPTYSHQIPMKAVSAGFAHQSNGQGNITKQDFTDVNLTGVTAVEPYLRNRSRSWNYLWVGGLMQFDSVFMEFRLWYRLPERGTNDNPDLIDYLGHGSLKFSLPYGKSLSTLMLRQNFLTGKGAQEFTWSYPLGQRENVFWFLKVFTGYGESLIDYNNYVTKFSAGFSFSR